MIRDPATITLEQRFAVEYTYPVVFTRDLFDLDNPAFAKVINAGESASNKLCVFLESQLLEFFPDFQAQVAAYARQHGMNLTGDVHILSGGEDIKADQSGVNEVLYNVDKHRIDRHSYLVAIGGGAFLDAVGFAAATAHRGIRHVRVPTTVLAQDDSGVGVKNAINFFGKKNWLGTFAPPFAVFNDFNFLDTLPERDWRAGMVEAVKVACIRDPEFFDRLEVDAAALTERDQPAMEYLVRRSAELHMQHIASGDAFEMGSARPLDFGHWAAHKLEALSNYALRHGEAVAIGIALDCIYARLEGRLSASDCDRVIDLLIALGFDLWATHLELRTSTGQPVLIAGLEEFREHLGGRLTVTLLEAIGHGVEVHHLDEDLILKALAELRELAREHGMDRHLEQGAA